MRLEKFLVKAKTSTYASFGETDEKKLKDGGRELLYREAEWAYRDRYFGRSDFLGEEVVWRNGKVVWAMNYFGAILVVDLLSPGQVFHFLKKALIRVTEKQPFRGPSKFTDGRLVYSAKTKGDIFNFFGEETIHYEKELIYRLRYHGGSID